MANDQQLPAFPSGDFPGYEPTRGLTKRELFAAMAMQGLVMNNRAVDQSPDTVAGAAIEVADALLAALDVSKENTDGR